MLQFNVDEVVQDSCQVCCCEQLTLRPGTTSKVVVNYGPWAIPIGRLHCEPTFSLEEMATCESIAGAPIKIGPLVNFDTPVNTLLEGDLTTKISDPNEGTMTFKMFPFNGAKHGTVVVETDGTFDYTPESGYQGEDRFYIQATGATGKVSTFEVLIGIGTTSSALMKETPHVSVEGFSVNYNHYYVTAAVKVAPTTQQCEVWRLTMQMHALDCNCVCYDRLDCFDIRMGTC